MTKPKLDPATLRYAARQLRSSRLSKLTTRGSGEETGVQTAERYWAWSFNTTARALSRQALGNEGSKGGEVSTTIDGWDCRTMRGQRSAAHEHGSATILPNGFLLVMKAIGDEEECTANTIPPAVLAWLIRPLLAQAYDEGNADDVNCNHYAKLLESE